MMTRILRNVELRELVLDPTATPGPGCTSPAVVRSAEGLRPLSLHGDGCPLCEQNWPIKCVDHADDW